MQITYEMYHHGIEGQKWGVRRFQNSDGTLTAEGKIRYRNDKKDLKDLKRKVSYSTKNMSEYGKSVGNEVEAYNKAEKEWTKESKRIVAPWNKEAQRKLINEKYDAVTEAAKGKANAISKLDRAERLYDKNAEMYSKKVDQMLNDYGSKYVKDIDTKTIKLGDHYTKEVIKTGLTLNDLPILGNKFRGDYISKEYRKMDDELIDDINRKRGR